MIFIFVPCKYEFVDRTWKKIIPSMLLFLYLLFFVSNIDADMPCIPRKFNYSSIVCVCNSTYCDDISEIKTLDSGNYILYSSSLGGARFQKREGKLFPGIKNTTSAKKSDLNILNTMYPKEPDFTVLEIQRNTTFQKIVGFGGSFSTSTGINIRSLSKATQKRLMDSYFSKNGLEYNMGRVPIGASDFSRHIYAYNEKPENDAALSNFSLNYHDFKHKISIIKEAKKLMTSDLYLIGAAWISPPWMKTNHQFTGPGQLIPAYYQTWADYHIRFLEEYEKKNVSFWAISTGNEPTIGIVQLLNLPILGWTPTNQGVWVANNFGPTMKKSKFKDVLILTGDDTRMILPWWMTKMSRVKNAMKYIDGLALHSYVDFIFKPIFIDYTRKMFPDKFIISTEMCTGHMMYPEKVALGSWKRAELYIESLLEHFNHWYVGWLDWNLALDKTGGPNFIGGNTDSPIITLPETDEFLKEPMFYAVGHFSKFIPRDSIRVLVNITGKDVENVAFLRPDGGITIICYNRFDENKYVYVQEDGKGHINFTIPPRSVHTLVYW